MKPSKLSIGLTTMVLLVALRLSLGCHFLYEGVWKIQHPKEFAAEAEGFLTGARGPMAPVFYAMVPDLDGRERLSGTLDKKVETDIIDSSGAVKTVKADRVRNEARTERWEALRKEFVAAHDDLRDEADNVFKSQLAAAEMYLADNWKEIEAHFQALDRSEEARRSQVRGRAAVQSQRNWTEMQKLRGEARAWLSALDDREEAYKAALLALVPEPKEGEAAPPDPFAHRWNPFRWSRMEQIRFMLTWALTGIGVCLMLGFMTRPAALAGGLFMAAVVMSQPSYPGVVPADPPQLGHALLINKDFVEMMALFVLASTVAACWGGFDWFIGRFLHGLCPRCASWFASEAEEPVEK